MFRDFPVQALATGLLAAIVGFASSFPVVLQGLSAVGASQREAASGLMALSIAMGVCAIVLSLRRRQPISIAWSTPGAALLATTATVDGGFATAVGAFLVCGALIVVAGIPEPLAEIAATSPRDFVRLAWHLGNRHTDVQIAGDRIRIRRDHVLEEMLRGLGATVRLIEAPFDPQATVPHSHEHVDHHHPHDHAHHHHHGHDHER